MKTEVKPLSRGLVEVTQSSGLINRVKVKQVVTIREWNDYVARQSSLYKPIVLALQQAFGKRRDNFE